MRYFALLLLLAPATFAQTFGNASSSATRTISHNLHLVGDAGAYSLGMNDQHPNLVFMTNSLPGGVRSVVQANIAGDLSPAQLALAKVSNGHLTIAVTCAEFSMLTISSAKTGKVSHTGTGDGCKVESLH